MVINHIMIIISGVTSQIGSNVLNKVKGKKNIKIITLGRNKIKNIKNIFMNIEENKVDDKQLIKLANKIKFFINIGYSRNVKKNQLNYKVIKKILRILGNRTISINVSTISAKTNSLYGKEKLKIEKEFTKYNGNNIRCGLIYSKVLGGFLKKLISTAENLKILFLPKFFKKKIFYLTKLNALIKIIIKIIEKKERKKNI